MPDTNITDRLVSNLGHEPTRGQRTLFQFLPQFLDNPEPDDILLVKGYAGTGKTTAMSSLVRTLHHFKIKTVLLAPTGRAAKVFTGITGMPARTIHKKIYRQKSSKDGFGTFVLDKNLHTKTFFIVDEASLISNAPSEHSIFGSGRLLEDLLSYVYSGNQNKLILVGDTAQLPPIGRDVSPALEKNELSKQGFRVFEFFLSEVVRQDEESGILENATSLRNSIQSVESGFPELRLSGFDDIMYLYGEDFLDSLNECYENNGFEETMVVVRSNKQANRYNAGIRSRILWREEQISRGDYLMVVKNNYFWMADHENLDFIANGDIFEVVGIGNYEDRFGHHYANISVRLVDYEGAELDVKVLLDTLDIESASLPSDAHKEMFYAVAEDYADITPKRKRWEKVKNDPYFNALQVKFAYAITCHKAQGGQWKNVFIDHGYFVEDMMGREYLRWLYTAFTRATRNLYLVNFNKQFVKDEG